jgi:hypothetical protein
MKNLARHSTPRWVASVIMLALFGDFIAASILGKTVLFPFSKDWTDYVASMVEVVASWAGVFFWVVFFGFAVVRPLLTGEKPHARDFKTFMEAAVNRIPNWLNRIVVSAPIMIALSVLLIYLLSRSISSACPCRSGSTPGRLAISTNGTSLGSERAVYKIRENHEEGSSMVTWGVELLGREGVCSPFWLDDITSIETIVLSFDEKRIYAVDKTRGVIDVINVSQACWLEEPQVLVRKTQNGNIVMALSGDDRKLYVAATEAGGIIQVFETSDLGREKRRIEDVKIAAGLFAASGAPRLFAITQGDDALYVIDTQTDRVEKRIPGFAVGTHVIATHDGRTAFVSTGNRLCRVRIDASEDDRDCKNRLPFPGGCSRECRVNDADGGISAMALTPDEKSLLVGNQPGKQRAGQILRYDVENPNPSSYVVIPGSERCGVPDSIVIAKDARNAKEDWQFFASYRHSDGISISMGDSQRIECGGSD